MNTSQVPTTSKKSLRFTVEENIALARLVEVNPAIWDLRNPLHSNVRAVAGAWDEIADVLKKTGILNR